MHGRSDVLGGIFDLEETVYYVCEFIVVEEEERVVALAFSATAWDREPSPIVFFRNQS
jgi:hypothetical protein